MAAALRLPMRVVALFDEGANMRSGNEMYIAAITAVPAVGPAAGDILFSSETAATSAPSTAGDFDYYLIDKHKT